MDARILSLIQQQGMLSVPLLHRQTADREHYALLNGARNNLCLDGNLSEQSEWYRKMAWSSGNNIYIAFDGGKCHIFRFDRPQIESYEENLIFDHANKFFDYLGKGTGNIENSIVPYVLRAYRQIRNEIRTENSGLDSLKALLYLLALSRDGENLNFDAWGMTAQDGNIVQIIERNKWDMIAENFMNGIVFTDKRLKPDIDLILRHTAGKLFEEANYIAYLPPQLNLFPDEKIKYSYETTQDGAYFTPAFVARSIVEEVLINLDLEGKESLTIFDPACGASGFLTEVLRQLKKIGFNKPIRIIGWDKAETAVMMSRFVLNFEKQEWGDNLTIDIQQCDSLSAENAWPRDVDVLLMNPPFLSWDRMKDVPQLREQVLQILPGIGRANLSAAFLAKAVDSVGENGVLGVVVPTRLLNDESYVMLRRILSESMTLKLVGGLGSYVFENVMTYTSMLVAKRERNSVGMTTVLWTNNVAGTASLGLRALRKHRYTNAVVAEKDYSVYETHIGEDQSSWRTDNYRNLELKHNIDSAMRRGSLKKSSKLFDIYLGARTGLNKVFVVPEEIVMSLPESERLYFRPSIDNLAIDTGHLYKANYLFYPHTKGLEPIPTEERLQELLPETYRRILFPARENLMARTSLRGNPRWWELSEHRSWQEEKKPKFVSTEFGHAGSFAIDYEGDYVVERGTMWDLGKKGWNPRMKYFEAYLAILNSPYFNVILGIYGEQLAGGDVFKLGKSYVGNLPLPDLSMPVYERYIPELRRFAQLMKEDLYWDAERLESLVREIYSYGE
ncbi:HsdM family class I SAM-dependent methyltransferase [Xylanibacter brevis]|uniref:HsdM family class I SAM-dependent methyltransferase n=1 Tax=Xylanibacter brevis TaxID=83231 RepID=UPI00047FBA28|nr:N-6 DNA methylase [Xylanibacter brevis]